MQPQPSGVGTMNNQNYHGDQNQGQYGQPSQQYGQQQYQNHNQSALNLTNNNLSSQPLHPLASLTPRLDNQQLNIQGNQTNQNQQQLQQQQKENEASISMYLTGIKVIAFLGFLFDVLYVEFYCLYIDACDPSGVVNITWMSNSTPAICLLTLLMIFPFYHASTIGDKMLIKAGKFICAVYTLVLIVLGIIAITTTTNLSSSDKQSVWDILAPVEKIAFGYQIQNLVTVNQKNIVYYIIYVFVLALLFFLYGIGLHLLDSKLFHEFTAMEKERLSFFKESLIKIGPRTRHLAQLEMKEKLQKKREEKKQKELDERTKRGQYDETQGLIPPPSYPGPGPQNNYPQNNQNNYGNNYPPYGHDTNFNHQTQQNPQTNLNNSYTQPNPPYGANNNPHLNPLGQSQYPPQNDTNYDPNYDPYNSGRQASPGHSPNKMGEIQQSQYGGARRSIQ